MIKIIETKSFILEDKQVFQIRYEEDGIVNDTEMFTIKDLKIEKAF